MTRRIASLVLAATLLASLVPSPSLAAGAEADIPGIRLPAGSNVATGILGGAVYDVVYAIDVPAGNVLVTALSGSAGTDFDLYLFPPSATTVVDSSQAVAKSTTSTSSEYITYASRLGGTYYLDLNGASDVQGEYRLEVRIVPDPSPASVALRFNGGASVTNKPDVTLELTAYDDLSGIGRMSFSPDGVTWTDWVPFAASYPWRLEGSDGRKKVYARVENGAGLVTATSSSIVLDTTPPVIIATSPERDSTTTASRPTFAVTFNEPILVRSWLTQGLSVRDPNGEVLAGSFNYDAAAMTGTFLPSADLIPGYDYSVTIGGVTDVAGNAFPPATGWTVGARRTSAVSFRSVAPVTYGRSVTLTATVAAPPGTELLLESRAADASTYTTVGTLVATSGLATETVRPQGTTFYRLTYPGTATLASSTSIVKVVVKRGITLVGSGPSVVRTARARRATSVVALVRPEAAGLRVTFTLYKRVGTKWRRSTVRSAVTRSDGTARISWSPAAGRWYWRASVAGTLTFAAGTSSNYRWTVR